MEEYEKKLRLHVLECTLEIEGLATAWLSGWLKIDPQTAKLIANTGTALSLQQKLFLLMDTGLVSRDQAKYFQCFFEIRNQFVHNPDAESFLILEPLLKLASRLKQFMPTELSEVSEEALFEAYGNLYKQVYSYLVSRVNAIGEKADRESKALLYERLVDFILSDDMECKTDIQYRKFYFKVRHMAVYYKFAGRSILPFPFHADVEQKKHFETLKETFDKKVADKFRQIDEENPE